MRGWRLKAVAASLAFAAAVLLMTGPADTAPQVIMAQPDDSLARPVTARLAGASIVLTYKDQWAGTAEEDEVAKDPPALLRFPGGTHAMYFDWESGSYRGLRISNTRAPSGYTLEMFFELAKRYGSEVSYIVNIYQDSPDKTGRLARLLAARGYKVRYWELGNEPYAEIFSDKFPDAASYLGSARAHALEIRKVFPDAELGLAADPKLRFSNNWNKALAAQTEFGNIVVHKYYGPVKKQREDMLSRSVQPDAAKAFSGMLEESDPDSDPPYACSFPGKRFWVTEWGLMYIGFDLQNSLAHAIWMGRAYIKMSRVGAVDAAMYWNLNASPFELIEPLKGGGFIRRAPFYVYRMARGQLTAAKSTMPVKLTSSGKSSADVLAQLYEDGQGGASMLIVNSGAEEQTVEIAGAAPGLTVEMISGAGLLETNGYSKAFTASIREQTTEQLLPTTQTVEGNRFKLPGYSVGTVGFKRLK